jgi:pyridoxal phosphate enzyme (YggS family)
MNSIEQSLDKIKKEIGEHVTLVAVSKTKPPEEIMCAYNAGQRIFGENKVQELLYKHETLPKDIEWHMIGHLQSNKVKYIAPFISLIHAVDSAKLLKTVNNEAQKNNRTINCLLQLKIAEEKSKFGWDENDLNAFIGSETYLQLSNINIVGVMGMATFTSNKNQIETEFRNLVKIFEKLKLNKAIDNSIFSVISMGMSDDYLIAVEEGSTMVRIGSHIFGKRNYT